MKAAPTIFDWTAPTGAIYDALDKLFGYRPSWRNTEPSVYIATNPRYLVVRVEPMFDGRIAVNIRREKAKTCTYQKAFTTIDEANEFAALAILLIQ